LRTNIYWVVWKLNLPLKIRSSRIYQRLIFGEATLRLSLVPKGFLMLGPTSAPVVPGLAAVMEHDKDPFRRRQAMLILLSIGEAASAPLVEAMTNHTTPDRTQILLNMTAIQRLGAGATSAVPALIQCLAENNPMVSIAASDALGKLATQPEIVIPALTNALEGTNYFVQFHIIRAIAQFGSRATNAVPTLLSLSQSRPRTFHDIIPREATNALRRIAPEVLSTPARKGGS